MDGGGRIAHGAGAAQIVLFDIFVFEDGTLLKK
jgi:hypothetical protein